MKLFSTISLFFVFCLFSLTFVFPQYASAATRFEISGWIPYWRTATGTADVLPHLKTFTSIMPFGYIVQNDGTLYDALGIEATSSAWAPFIAAAKKDKVYIIPTVMWSNGAAIQTILSNQTSRIALEKRIATLAKTQKFDGIDIDFEGKQAETKNYFSLFLKGLYMRMGNKWVYCSIEARTPVADRYDSTPPPDATMYANDFTQINKYCDRVELMTYDQETVDVALNKTAPGPYIPIADPRWITAVVKLAERSIAKNKLEIGIATYGYEWTVTPLSISGYRYSLDWAFNPQYGLDLAAKLNVSPVRNAAGELSLSYISSGVYAPTGPELDVNPSNTFSLPMDTYTNGTTTISRIATPFNIVWWSDAQAIAQKIALAKKLGIRGVAIFKLDGGEDPNIWNVLK